MEVEVECGSAAVDEEILRMHEFARWLWKVGGRVVPG